ncbi:hypothetical protein Nepgr_020016 [Nepenthes gracilis]|uniref:Uncharacterized protein n=1 Tax=Nepenthes gracilis TaxID=150966 RepID=A0AAD3SW37_NEPGR|nr:hypothetical protein Nepgr_020016 [Nepenthes gracilis]
MVAGSKELTWVSGIDVPTASASWQFPRSSSSASKSPCTSLDFQNSKVFGLTLHSAVWGRSEFKTGYQNRILKCYTSPIHPHYRLTFHHVPPFQILRHRNPCSKPPLTFVIYLNLCQSRYSPGTTPDLRSRIYDLGHAIAISKIAIPVRRHRYSNLGSDTASSSQESFFRSALISHQ